MNGTLYSTCITIVVVVVAVIYYYYLPDQNICCIIYSHTSDTNTPPWTDHTLHIMSLTLTRT